MNDMAKRVLARHLGKSEQDPWVDRDFVAKFCPDCADKMAAKGLRAIRASVLFGKESAKWETMPEGWTGESRKKFWDSIGGSVTKCMEAIKGHVSDPGAFCAALKDRIEGTTGWRGPE